ncbi:DotA/TraY family protein [Acetobacter pasteurianus]|uniref:DotA/TraY family protein n=1 Tax=Acetobacter pasteurianus TaxID=438 RepID=UPI0013647EA9|nr:DotA/TraY family protein [Acetobacter pasteurianus]QHM90355.1 DotA/TraY family protein [Acetobacter pasteurianus]
MGSSQNHSRVKDFAERGKTEILKGLIVDDLVKGKGLGKFGLGPGVTKDIISAGNVASTAAQMIGKAFNYRPTIDYTLPDEETDPVVRFDMAAKHYELTKQKACRIQDAKYKNFWTLWCILICMLSLFASAYIQHRLSIHMTFMCVAVSCCILSQMFIASFYNWQIRSRRLGSLSEFASLPNEWLPVAIPKGAPKAEMEGFLPKFIANIIGVLKFILRKVRNWLPFIIAGWAALHPIMAMAADTGVAGTLLNPLPNTDIWGRVLGFLFPDIPPISDLSGARHTAISNGIQDGMGAMISDLCAISLLVISYQMVVGAAETAHQGELLGRKWHTMWSLPRVCYGYAALAPVVKGFCLLQVLIVYVIVVSGNMGNTIWSSFVDGLIQPEAITPVSANTDELALNAFKVETCFATYREMQKNNGVGEPDFPTKVQTESNIAYQAFHTIISGLSSLWSGNDTSTSGGATDSQVVTSWKFAPCGTISITSPANASDAAGTLAKAQINAFDTFLKSLEDPARYAYLATVSGSDGVGLDEAKNHISSVIQAKKTYDSALGTAATQFVQSVRGEDLSDFKNAVEQAGWISAGSYYMTIARINTMILDITKNIPTVSVDMENSIDSDKLYEKLNAKPNGPFIIADDMWNSIAYSSAQQVSSLDKGADAMNAMHGGAMYYLKQIGSPDSYGQSALLGLSLAGNADTYDTMQDTVIMGNYLVDLGEGALLGSVLGMDAIQSAAQATPEGKIAKVATTVADKFSGIQKKLGMLSKATGYAGQALFLLFLSLMLAGIYDAFILPMLPYLHFFFATVGIMVLAVEGVIAGPIWAFMHIRMDGDELFTGSQSPGYRILFNLLFRIPLTLFGFFFSMLVFDACIWLQHLTIWPAMESATADASFGLVGTVVYMIVITGMTYTIANRSFAMITAVPDRVTRWFSGESAASGDETQLAMANVGSIRGKVQGGVSNAAGMASRQGGGGSRGSSEKADTAREAANITSPTAADAMAAEESTIENSAESASRQEDREGRGNTVINTVNDSEE